VTRGGEMRRLGGLAVAVAALHVVGWGLIAVYSSSYPVLVGLAGLAYGFGLRHAFDADHIAAIDNTTRKLLQEGRRPLGVGFCFSLGHSTVVFGLAIGLAGTAQAIPGLQETGGLIGAGVSGGFLLLIGILNLVVLVDIAAIARGVREGGFDERALEERLLDRGLMSRLFFRRLFGLISRSWHMYPLGLLFGLGFDTASEVGLLALTAGAATGHTPLLAILALPTLFAAGMALMDTADGVFMAKAYGWAFSNPVRRLSYNLTVTTLSVVVALCIGGVELAQVWGWLGGLDLQTLGYGIVAAFVFTWAVALAVWKVRTTPCSPGRAMVGTGHGERPFRRAHVRVVPGARRRPGRTAAAFGRARRDALHRHPPGLRAVVQAAPARARPPPAPARGGRRAALAEHAPGGPDRARIADAMKRPSLFDSFLRYKMGTGGSSGAGYLRPTLFQPAFPDLWAVRGRL
jgi:high-affinity nickel-transport protein